MPWIRFDADFSFTPLAKRTITIAYKRGMVLLVTTECAEMAILNGKATRTSRPKETDDAATRDR